MSEEMLEVELHTWYGPCDSFGPNLECSECARFFMDEEEWLVWLRSDR